jgi:DnaJ-class molecular chaperone
LYLLEDAPLEIVKCVYKTLATQNHPDVGGDADAMVEINAAYEQILKTKSAS